MAIPAHLIKNVSFRPEVNKRGYGAAPYSIDWDTGVKTVNPQHFDVTEGGAVWLTSNGMQDPDTRALIHRAIGHEVLLASELPKVYDPVTKEVVTKKSINGDRPYIIEPDTGRVFCLSKNEIGQHGGYAMWVDPRGPITVFGEVKTLQRDVKAEKKWMEDNAWLVHRAKAVCALEDIRRGSVGQAVACAKERNDNHLGHLGWALEHAREDLFSQITSRKIKYKYLLTDPSKY